MTMRILFIVLGINCGLSAENVVISNQSNLPCKIFLPRTMVSDVVTVPPFEESKVLAVEFDDQGSDNILYLSSGIVGSKAVRVITSLDGNTKTAVFDFNKVPDTRAIMEGRYENIHIIISPDGSVNVEDGTKIVNALSRS